jgi:hypothetical protein
MRGLIVRIIAVSLVVCGSSVAIAGGQGAGPERGAFTDADLDLFVDVAGNDANDCTAPGASACLTIQGAVDKVPKRIRHKVTITVGVGEFAGVVIEGFSVESSHQPNTGAGLDIRGTMVNIKQDDVAPGPVTGTATNCDGGGYQINWDKLEQDGLMRPLGEYGTGNNLNDERVTDPRQHATLVKDGAFWTSGKLRGKFLALTSGPGVGQMLAIEDNTPRLIGVSTPSFRIAGVITLAGYWDDYHQNWVNCAPNLGNGDQTPNRLRHPGAGYYY